MSQFPGQNQQGQYPPGFFDPGGGYDRMKAAGYPVGPDPREISRSSGPPVSGPMSTPDFSNPNWATRPTGPGTYTWSDGQWRGSVTPAQQASWDRAQQQRAADARNKNWIKAGLIGTGALLTGGALGALGGGGAAAGGIPGVVSGAPITAASQGAAFGVPTVTGTTIGALAPAAATTVGSTVAASVPWWRSAGLLNVGQLGAQTFGQIYGANKVSTSNREALAAQQRANDQAQQIALADREESRRQFDLQQAALKADLDARNKFEADKFAASEEERLYNRRLAEEREARRAPYRQASAEALARIPGILASGRATPGLGTFGSYRR